MARKLSRYAQGALISTSFVTLALCVDACSCKAQSSPAPGPLTTQNRFVQRGNQAIDAQNQTQQTGSRGATYRNPFKHGSTATNDASFRYGPSSRWQRYAPLPNRNTPISAAPIEQPPLVETVAIDASLVGSSPDESDQDDELSVRSAILAADDLLGPPPRLGHSPLGPVLQASAELRIPAESIDTIPPSTTDPPDPLQFAAESDAQPIWLQSNSTKPFSQVDQAAFERALGEEPQREQVRMPEQEVEIEDPDEAVIISDQPDSPQNWLAQAQELAAEAKSLEQLSEITKLCERVIGNDASSELAGDARNLCALAHNRRGELLVESNRQRDAIEEFATAISLDNTCAAAIHNRGVTLAQQLDFDAALADFNRVIELNPDLGIAYRNRAELLSAQGKLSEAVADYTRAVNATPDDPELYRARAHALQSLGHFDRAIADLNYSIQLDPTSAACLTQRGNIMAERGDFGHALADFRQAAAIDPQLADAQRSLAWFYATCPEKGYRDGEKALAAAEQAVKLSGTSDYFALEALAAAQANAGQFDAAVDTQREAANVAPAQVAKPLQQRLELYEKRQPYRSQILRSAAIDN